MRWIVLWTLAVVAAVIAEVWWFAAPDVRRGDVGSLESHLTGVLQKAVDERRLGSAALVLVARGEIVAEHGFGTPIDPELTRFRVASVSKAVTAWGVMRLVQEGRIGLDDPVMRHLRQWRFPGSDARREKVTVRHLLTHTGGVDGDRVVTREPGTAFAYSNASSDILQLMIEDVTRQPFVQYMNDTVLRPLGMTHSSFDCATEALAPNLDAELNVVPHGTYTPQASVSLCASPRDLARFARAFAVDNPVLTRDTLRQMMEPQPATSGSWGLGLALFAPGIVGHVGGAAPAWGANIRVNPATGDALILTATGGRRSINRLGGDWIYWETGEVPAELRREVVYDRLRPASLAIVAGALVILGVRWRKRPRRT